MGLNVSSLNLNLVAFCFVFVFVNNLYYFAKQFSSLIMIVTAWSVIIYFFYLGTYLIKYFFGLIIH